MICCHLVFSTWVEKFMEKLPNPILLVTSHWISLLIYSLLPVKLHFFVSEQNLFWSFWWFNTPAVGWTQFFGPGVGRCERLRCWWKKHILGWDRLRVQNKGINDQSVHRFSCFWIFLVCNPPRKKQKTYKKRYLTISHTSFNTKSVGVICSQNLELISSGVQVWGTRSAVDTSENPEKV